MDEKDTRDPRPEINYPLVEETRPQLYRAMKYWGKKPHNIWAQYIDRYTPPGGLVADPFAGSAIAAFEAVKLGRKALAFDLNPLSAFIIEVTASGAKLHEKAFHDRAMRIREAAEATDVYQQNFRRTRRGDSEQSSITGGKTDRYRELQYGWTMTKDRESSWMRMRRTGDWPPRFLSCQ